MDSESKRNIKLAQAEYNEILSNVVDFDVAENVDADTNIGAHEVVQHTLAGQPQITFEEAEEPFKTSHLGATGLTPNNNDEYFFSNSSNDDDYALTMMKHAVSFVLGEEQEENDYNDETFARPVNNDENTITPSEQRLTNRGKENMPDLTSMTPSSTSSKPGAFSVIGRRSTISTRRTTWIMPYVSCTEEGHIHDTTNQSSSSETSVKGKGDSDDSPARKWRLIVGMVTVFATLLLLAIGLVLGIRVGKGKREGHDILGAGTGAHGQQGPSTEFQVILSACENVGELNDSSISESLKTKAIKLIDEVPKLNVELADVYKTCTPESLAFWWLANDVNTFSPEVKLERFTLAVFYIVMRGEGWRNADLWLSEASMCNWEGIMCSTNTTDDTVIDIILGNNNLEGSIHKQLATLTNLRGLILETNAISGSLPTEIGLLSSLVTLDVSANALTGVIPSEIGLLTQMEALNLGINFISGKIPSTIGLLTKITDLHLNVNSLEGTIPVEIWYLGQLQRLDISLNPTLRGTLATEIGMLTDLISIYAHSCSLTGTIPTTIGLCISLRDASFRYTKLSGQLPSELATLTNLQTLDLYGTALTGTIPIEMCELPMLTNLYLPFIASYPCVP